MAKVSLRIYNREIESLIDQGGADEAIAHCHHILKSFSKHLATYRLLGKAYLESKHYAEAVDIFGRVLMSVPDDFVSHVGMSIISDEQNKLDDAIWHMQRAFESQPSNSAIQGELQRLYGRRDGMEPPKIRMTRGALAQMYVQGELYPQAIAEIRAVLSQEPERADMQVLLARAYFRGGQKADASDMCAQLLKRYLYCFDANRIMVDLLPPTAVATENAQVYRTRVSELDPYAAFVKGSVFNSNEVADAVVSLERLDYKESDTMGQQWTSSAPMLASSSSSDQPDWLKSGGFSDSQTNALASSQPDSLGGTQSGEAIPDFLRDAGWGESNTPEQPTSIFDPETPSGDLTPADIPDWLKGQVPSNTAQSASAQPIETPDWLSGLGSVPAADSFASTQPAAPAQSADAPDWLKGLGDSQPAPAEPAQNAGAFTQSADTPDWLKGLGDSQPAQNTGNTSVQTADTPDWLKGLGDSEPVQTEPVQSENVFAQSTDTPDWLKGLGDSQSTEAEPIQSGNGPDSLTAFGTSQTPEAAQPAEVPDWLSGLGNEESEPAQPGNVPDWLAGLGDDSKTAESVQPGSAPDWLAGLDEAPASDAIQPGNVPDWLTGLGDTPTASTQASVNTESLGSTAQEQDDAVAWLESLAAKHGAKPEELVTDPNKRSETPPEWVSQAQNVIPQTPAASVESLGSTAQEQDDAVAWLESLAAKHGAKPEELVTDPNKRFDTPPEWVSQAQAIGEEQSSAMSNAQDQAAQPAEPVENALNIGEQFFAEFENTASAAPAPSADVSTGDETGMWLRSLEEQEKQDNFSAQTASDIKDVPDWLSDSHDQQPKYTEKLNVPLGGLPDWLNDSQPAQNVAPQPDFAEEEPAVQKSDLPNWLSGADENLITPDAFPSLDVPQSDLSNWLSGLDDEPGLPFDQLPTPDSILMSSMPTKTPKKLAEPDPVASKSDLPDWLSGLDSKDEESENDWQQPVAEEPPVVPAPQPIEEPVEEPVEEIPAKPEPVYVTEDLPDWLQSTDEEEVVAVDDDTTPWMHREAFEAKAAQTPQPTSPSDWHPVEAKQPMASSAPAEKKTKQSSSAPVAQSSGPAQSPVERTPAASAKKKTGLPAKQRVISEVQGATAAAGALEEAKGELDRGDIPTALDHYKKLIKKGKHLDETIRDLTESIYRYPVEVGIWQTLGDAYMRANRLKEALEAYNKAEELIR